MWASASTIKLLKMGEPGDAFAEDFVNGGLQSFLGVLQFFPNPDVLGAVLFTFAAADAIGGGSGIFPEGGAF